MTVETLKAHVADLEKAAAEAMLEDRDQHAVFCLGQIDILKTRIKLLESPHAVAA